MRLDKKVKSQQQQLKKQTSKPLRGRDLIPGPLAPKVDALPLHYQVN